jgi:hypothetical protein
VGGGNMIHARQVFYYCEEDGTFRENLTDKLVSEYLCMMCKKEKKRKSLRIFRDGKATQVCEECAKGIMGLSDEEIKKYSDFENDTMVFDDDFDFFDDDFDGGGIEFGEIDSKALAEEAIEFFKNNKGKDVSFIKNIDAGGIFKGLF